MSKNQNNRIKASHHTWWIGGLIGFIYAVSHSQSDDIGMLIFAWVTNGLGWGWFCGYLIDKIVDIYINQTVNLNKRKVSGTSNKQAYHSLSYTNTGNYNMGANDYFEKGQAKVLRHDYKGAIDDYTRAIEVNPKFTNAYLCRGNAKCGLKDYGGGITDYTKVLEFDPKDGNTFYLRGIARGTLNDYNGAIEDLSSALDFESEDVTIYQLRGAAKLQVNDFVGARQDYTKALALDPDDAISYYNRGLARLLSGSKFSAYSDLKRAGELGHTQAYQLIKEAGLS